MSEVIKRVNHRLNYKISKTSKNDDEMCKNLDGRGNILMDVKVALKLFSWIQSAYQFVDWS